MSDEERKRLETAKRVAPELRALTEEQWTAFNVIETAYRADLLDRYEAMIHSAQDVLQVSEDLIRYVIQPPR